MKTSCLLLFCLLYFIFVTPVTAQNAKPENGAVLEQAAYAFPAYEQLPDWTKSLYTPESYRQFTDSPDVELVKIKYASDDLKINGFIYKPKKTDKKLPVVFWNRSGVGEAAATGNQNFHNIYEMYRIAKAGFVVVASQFRGTGGSEGTDEIGGADTRDLMNLLPLARRLAYADTNNLYAFGASRGAMMTLQAVRDGLPIKAAVVVGTPTDWNEMLRLHPEIVPEAKKIWRDFDARRDEHVKNRSAVFWADKLNIPLLILNGADDAATPPAMSYALAQKLAETGGVYELTIYARDDHLISNNREDRLQRTIDWFRNPPKKNIAAVLLKTARADGAAAAIKQYRDLKASNAASYDWRESELNQLGYALLRERRAKDAVEIFKLNVETYPNSSNVYDSLGEGLMFAGDRDGAIKNYKRSLELNPQNTNAVEAIKKLEAEMNKPN